MTRTIALVPLMLYALYLFLQYQESRGGGSEQRKAARVSVSGSASKDWLLLLGGLGLVVAGVEGLLRTAIWLEHRTG